MAVLFFKPLTYLAAVSIFCLLGFGVFAAEFRQFKPILAPSEVPKDAKVVEPIKPVSRDKVEQATEKLLASWNQGDLEKHLAQDFYDKDRLLDSVADKVPRDATLRLTGIQGSQTLEQFERTRDNQQETISLVSVTANTQLEFNDPERGFRRLDGRNEFVLRITETSQ